MKNGISAFKVVKEQVAHHTSRVIMNPHDPSILYTICLYQGYRRGLDANSGQEREALRFCLTSAIGASNQVGADGAGTLRFRILRQESQSLPTWETIYGENRSQEPCVSIKFDCFQTGQIEGPPFRGLFSDRAYPWISECGFRRTHEGISLGLRKIDSKDQVFLQLSEFFVQRRQRLKMHILATKKVMKQYLQGSRMLILKSVLKKIKWFLRNFIIQ